MVQYPFVAPMLATPGRLPLPGGDHRWAAETKQDGQRAMIHLPGDGTMVITSRNGTEITEGFPELHGLAAAVGGTPALLDGEIVALDTQGHPDFQRLQSRIGLERTPARAARLAASVPVHVMLFDVMMLAGQDLMSQPWTERRDALLYSTSPARPGRYRSP
ncbi:bifunctional non-homologous end joining protein LigD [Actinacidiphila alni]|uniref:Bifunctional non-homologous end joining protein LigD n=1 Tax=Actinacidiphila alni TaxID=380248 RepID=A0A1I2MND5_9ACTN|nr:hypothetical protein [Actinacidiphila alni]SFF93075.1 bifunctional non-homologous end joining protein LigD [Actinacidiphila alni]